MIEFYVKKIMSKKMNEKKNDKPRAIVVLPQSDCKEQTI